jgi:cytidine deaminase
MINNELIIKMFAEAQKAAEKAYSPYSKFRVGAALLCEDGNIITGCNVENRSFGLTICAERSAVVAAVTQGIRRFTALAISTPDSTEPVGPCGACRQVLSEFMLPDSPVFFNYKNSPGGDVKWVNTTIGDLLPWDSLYDLLHKQPSPEG